MIISQTQKCAGFIPYPWSRERDLATKPQDCSAIYPRILRPSE
ncbi:hypothetical protein COLSTE_00690 [Collinsella stercoris DSM 13279]|uniref:Uncharacterized protein n=1 Tax=Collinsella stercoris DSM 13279 TaxID=445975 RepID=B6G9E9_9ACTN|nr:hypothetical protein COLSTE_00690 [Collinsella stercoris DSM 13279]